MAKRVTIGEAGIIERYFAPLSEKTPGAYGLSDDAGLISPGKGKELVLTTDMIVEGVHYLAETDPKDIAYKALAVNVSDLCSKGANPSIYLMSIALSGSPAPEWLEALSAGFAEAQEDFGCSLLGGDTVYTPGPTAISVTAAGYVPEGAMVHRSGAKPGDHVYVTGTIGDGALGLRCLQGEGVDNLSPSHREFLTRRYKRPEPRLAAISAVRLHANAAMDISDGLAGDFAKLVSASNTGGAIQAADVPLSDAAAQWLEHDPDTLEVILTGGDDYEVLMSVPEKNTSAFEKDCSAAGLSVARIGRIFDSPEGARILREDGKALAFKHPGYDHF